MAITTATPGVPIDPNTHAPIKPTVGVSAIQTRIQPPTVPAILTPESMATGLLDIPSMLEVGNMEVEHAIVYGGPGTGKTTLAGLLAEFFNILWIDGDKGLSAISHNLPDSLLKRIRPIRVPDNPSTPNFAPTLLKLATGRRVEICREHGSVDCPLCKGRVEKLKYPPIVLNDLPKNWVVVVDSMTQFYASARALAYYKLNPKAAGVANPDVDEQYKGDYDFWGICWNFSDKLGNYVKDLKCQFVIISHETMAEMEDKAKRLVPVGGSSNVSAGYSKFYGTVVYANNINNKIVYSTSATNKSTVQTKSRSNVFLETEETPSLIHVFRPEQAKELLKGSYNEWYLKEGWKAPALRKEKIPQPKEILPV